MPATLTLTERIHMKHQDAIERTTSLATDVATALVCMRSKPAHTEIATLGYSLALEALTEARTERMVAYIDRLYECVVELDKERRNTHVDR